MTRDIRELAQRAELEFHQQPHRFRRRAWLSGVVLALACGSWLVWAAVRGDHEAYDAGGLSKAHAFISNDCRQCHTTWQPVRRLFSIGSTVSSAENSSVSNEACVKCHAAAEHNHRQIPAHASLSCSECHREHQGKLQLVNVTDQHCVRCHGDLKTTDGPSDIFYGHIYGFSNGHVPFNLEARLNGDGHSNLLTRTELDALLKKDPVEGPYQKKFLDVLTTRPANFQPKPGQPPPTSKWQDRGDIKFNHAAHLVAQGVKDKDGKTVVLSNNCQACHVPDPAGRYMLPIQYQQHCAQCHPLLYDNQNYAGDAVPHALAEIVRGYLTQKYTLTVLDQKKELLVESPPPRPFPGQPDRSPLSAEQGQKIKKMVLDGEQFARSFVVIDTLPEAEQLVEDKTRVVKSRGGCKLCHTVSDTAEDGTWTVNPPDIPNRWFPHSRFGHTAHRMLGCSECHHKVSASRDTADVLMPTMSDCRTCHISENATPRKLQSKGSLAHDLQSSCVMCHTYHRHSPEQPSGQFNKHLTGEPDVEPTGELERAGR